MKLTRKEYGVTARAAGCFVMILFLCLAVLEEAGAATRTVIVGFHKKPGTYEKDRIRRARGHIRRTFGTIRAMAITIDEKELANLLKEGSVAYIEEDAIIQSVDPVVSQEYTDSWGVYHIGAETAHASGNRGAGVKIAVIDTGIDYTHDDLRDSYRGGYDFVFNDSDPFDDSRNSHGTHIAGIIAAQQNGFGVVGVAPEADIYALKVLDGAGFGLLSWIIAAIEWSIDNGIDIINMSLQGIDFQSLRDACDSAAASGVLVVAAGGNSHGGAVSYPAAYDSVMAVTGTDPFDMKSSFSPVGEEIELAAPGTDIYSTQAGFSYGGLGGTSQAAAHVTGAAALFYNAAIDDVNGDLIIDGTDVREALQGAALDLGEPGRDSVFGYGRVDAAGAALEEPEALYLELKRRASPPWHDAEAVILGGGVYDIIIENYGLRGVRLAVYDDGVRVKRMSRNVRFFHKKGRFMHDQEMTKIVTIDARDSEYDLYLIPYGRPGTSADVTITEK
ncbi:MAG: S8 family peptidase [Nitrospiraceae bacterium]|nr:MAG: S8 family peptidase [Nitrospiraceae bacterium]